MTKEEIATKETERYAAWEEARIDIPDTSHGAAGFFAKLELQSKPVGQETKQPDDIHGIFIAHQRQTPRLVIPVIPAVSMDELKKSINTALEQDANDLLGKYYLDLLAAMNFSDRINVPVHKLRNMAELLGIQKDVKSLNLRKQAFWDSSSVEGVSRKVGLLTYHYWPIVLHTGTTPKSIDWNASLLKKHMQNVTSISPVPRELIHV